MYLKIKNKITKYLKKASTLVKRLAKLRVKLKSLIVESDEALANKFFSNETNDSTLLAWPPLLLLNVNFNSPVHTFHIFIVESDDALANKLLSNAINERTSPICPPFNLSKLNLSLPVYTSHTLIEPSVLPLANSLLLFNDASDMIGY